MVVTIGRCVVVTGLSQATWVEVSGMCVSSWWYFAPIQEIVNISYAENPPGRVVRSRWADLLDQVGLSKIFVQHILLVRAGSLAQREDLFLPAVHVGEERVAQHHV